MNNYGLENSDFLLHSDSKRFEVYKNNKNIWWSKQLHKWMCTNPDLIQNILNSENFVVHQYRIDRLEKRFEISLPFTIKMISQIPLALNGEAHKLNRKKLAIEIQKNSKSTLFEFEKDLIGSLDLLKKQTPSLDLLTDVLKPPLLKAMLNMSGMHNFNFPFEFDILSEIFDVTVGIDRRLAIEVMIEEIYSTFADSLSEDEKYLKIATLALGTESLVSTIGLSVAAVLDTNTGKPCKEMVWEDKITATAVPIVERVAKSDMLIDGVNIAKGDAIRLFLEASGFDESGCRQYSQLFFGSGQHMCLGTFVGNEMWKIIVNAFSQLDLAIRVRELKFKDSYSFNSLEKLVVEVL